MGSAITRPATSRRSSESREMGTSSSSPPVQISSQSKTPMVRPPGWGSSHSVACDSSPRTNPSSSTFIRDEGGATRAFFEGLEKVRDERKWGLFDLWFGYGHHRLIRGWDGREFRIDPIHSVANVVLGNHRYEKESRDILKEMGLTDRQASAIVEAIFQIPGYRQDVRDAILAALGANDTHRGTEP
jgi:hypothetical protein